MNVARLKVLSVALACWLALPAVAQPPVGRGYVFLCEHVRYEDSAYARLGENSVERYLARGEAYHKRAQYDRAIAEFKKGVRVAPDDARLYFHLGSANFSPRRHKEAIGYFRKALKLKPGMYQARGYLGLSLGYLGRAKDSAAELAATPRVPPITAQQHNYTASLYFFRRNYAGAIAAATLGIRAHPSDGPYMARGRAYLAQGRLREAAADFTTLIKVDSGSAWARSYRADIYERLGRRQEALSDRREFLRLNTETLR